MGKAGAKFEREVLDIVEHHFPKLDPARISRRPSRDGNYLALSVTVPADNQQQLDTIYQALSNCPSVIMAL